MNERTPNSQLPTPNAAYPRRGFSVTELLVVIGIIVLIGALALPAFNVMTGSRSIDTATNTVGAMLGQARSEAISRGHPVGLAIFTDAASERTAMALVSYPQPWRAGVTYEPGDMVYVQAAAGRTYPDFYLCAEAHTSTQAGAGSQLDEIPSSANQRKWRPAGNSLPTTVNNALQNTTFPSGQPDPTLPYVSSPGTRNYSLFEYVSVIPETEMMFLPPGIVAQVLNNAVPARTTQTVQSAPLDRYLSVGVIMFDADGRLAEQRVWGVLYDGQNISTASSSTLQRVSSRLGMMIRFPGNGIASSQNIDPGVVNTTTLTVSNGQFTDLTRTGLGVVLFDRREYSQQGFPAWDAQLLNPTSDQYTVVPSGASKSEQDKETWIDENGTLLLINRFTGTLVKSE